MLELKSKCDAVEKREAETRKLEEKKHQEELQALKKTNQQLQARHFSHDACCIQHIRLVCFGVDFTYTQANCKLHYVHVHLRLINVFKQWRIQGAKGGNCRHAKVLKQKCWSCREDFNNY